MPKVQGQRSAFWLLPRTLVLGCSRHLLPLGSSASSMCSFFRLWGSNFHFSLDTNNVGLCPPQAPRFYLVTASTLMCPKMLILAVRNQDLHIDIRGDLLQPSVGSKYEVGRFAPRETCREQPANTGRAKETLPYRLPGPNPANTLTRASGPGAAASMWHPGRSLRVFAAHVLAACCLEKEIDYSHRRKYTHSRLFVQEQNKV